MFLFTKLKVEPANGFLKTSHWAQVVEEDRKFILHITEKIEEGKRVQRKRELRETFLESSSATIIWLIECPPVGFYSLYKSNDFGGLMKLLLTVGGLYCLGKWISFFH